jgi:hypothetical protein
MVSRPINPSSANPGKWFFLSGFIFATLLFWWMPSLLFRFVAHFADPIEDSTIAISVGALALFVLGYLLPARTSASRFLPAALMDSCEDFAYNATIVLFIAALPAAILCWSSMSGGVSTIGGHIPSAAQVLFYVHMFFAFMCLGSSDPTKHGWRRYRIIAILLILPRLIVSLHGGRFFVAQAIVPVVLIAIARGWIHFSTARIVQISALAAAIIFVPAATRGDDISGPNGVVEFLAGGGSLRLFQDNKDLSLNGRCPPLLVSMTAKIIPYGPLGVCVIDDFAGLKKLPATAGRIITDNDPLSFHGTTSGTGSNYLIELYLAGGLFAAFAGSAIFGVLCRHFIGWIGHRSIFAGIWAESLTRALLAPRGELGYVFERIPSLVLATLLVVFAIWAGQLLRTNCAGIQGSKTLRSNEAN